MVRVSHLSSGTGARSDAQAPGLAPSLSISHNSIECDHGTVNKLLGSHKRTADNLTWEIQCLARTYGINRLGFLTLTFGDHITSIREAQRRFNSLNTNVLKTRYERAICCVERSRNRRIHFHLVVVLPSDIRTGFDFGALARRDYRSANSALRSEWSFWRKTAIRFGFGRTELLPVKSCADGLARYVGKYVAKHVGHREGEDKGARLVRYVGFGPGDRKGSSRFSWAGGHSFLWRLKLHAFALSVGVESMDALRRLYGPRWAFFLQDAILQVSDESLGRALQVRKGPGRAHGPVSSSGSRTGACTLDCNRNEHPPQVILKEVRGGRVYQLKRFDSFADGSNKQEMIGSL